MATKKVAAIGTSAGAAVGIPSIIILLSKISMVGLEHFGIDIDYDTVLNSMLYLVGGIGGVVQFILTNRKKAG